MPRAMRKVSSTGIYHVLYRGINQQRIFEEDEDYELFLTKLKELSASLDIHLLAYCLMSNHMHLLLQESSSKLEQLFRRLITSYVSYFNKKYKRTGHLFQDRYKSEPVESDAYFLVLFSYIHQNPVRAGVCLSAGDYPWSSLHSLGKDTSLVDEEKLFLLISKDELMSVGSLEKSELFDPFAKKRQGRRQRHSDDDVIELLEKYCGLRTSAEFQKLGKDEQQKVVVYLNMQGASIRQIARICGLSKGIVEKWLSRSI